MDVVIIVDVMRFTKEDVVKDIREEGYQHNFMFANFNAIDVVENALKNADEVWVWGDCKDLKYLKLAKEMGCDIWQMKL